MILNPVFVFLCTWGGVLFLYSLELTTNLVSWSPIGLMVIVMNMLFICIVYFFVSTKNKPVRNNTYDGVINSYTNILICIWLVGTLAEMFYSDGFPLYWRIMNIPKLYTDFGVPSLHGIMNAIYLQLLTMLYYLHLNNKSKLRVILIVALFFWPVCMLGRGILLSAILQMLCVNLFMRRIKISHYIIFLILGLSVVVLFGVLGDMRQTVNPFAYLIRDNDSMLHYLPSGFLWFYVYLTAGLSNFFYNVDMVSPTLLPLYSFSNMLPSIIRTYLELDPRNDLFTFVDPNLNTSTAYAGFVSDFGAIGAFILMGLIQTLCCYIYSLARNGRPWFIFAYTVAFQILVFSIFYDMFFLLPTLFQFAVSFGLYVFYKSKINGAGFGVRKNIITQRLQDELRT